MKNANYMAPNNHKIMPKLTIHITQWLESTIFIVGIAGIIHLKLLKFEPVGW